MSAPVLRRRAPGLRRLVLALAGALAPAVAPVAAHAQATDSVPILGIEATPGGALPPLALPMPASRNHNYWVVRGQIGNRQGRDGPDLLSVAGGVDLQWRGGSIFGVTGGYQFPDCQDDPWCDGHAFFGARARFNVVTGGPTIAELFHDYSATSTLGAELGFGYAPDAAPGYDACTVDFGLPISVAMIQRVRLVTYVMPSASFDVDCGSGSNGHKDLLLNAGFGVQQLWLRGLDLYLGAQKIVRGGTGYQLGLSIMYVHLP